MRLLRVLVGTLSFREVDILSSKTHSITYFLSGVWVSILSAVLVVSALLWALEWLSPYSYYNNM